MAKCCWRVKDKGIAMKINDILAKYKIDYRPVGRIICKDGFSMSVQAGDTLYCSPRSNQGPWDEVEVGFPSHEDKDLLQYAERPNHPVDTVYAYVPVALVESVMEKHGGFDRVES